MRDLGLDEDEEKTLEKRSKGVQRPVDMGWMKALGIDLKSKTHVSNFKFKISYVYCL